MRQHLDVRTTLVLDDDVHSAARELARDRNTSIGSVISALARAGMRPTSVDIIDGPPVIRARPDATVITSAIVSRSLDDE